MPTWGYSLETQNTSAGKVPEDKRGTDTPVPNPPHIRVLSRAPGRTKDQCPPLSCPGAVGHSDTGTLRGANGMMMVPHVGGAVVLDSFKFCY